MERHTSRPVAVGAAAWDGGDLIGPNMNLAVSGRGVAVLIRHPALVSAKRLSTASIAMSRRCCDRLAGIKARPPCQSRRHLV